MTVIKSFSPPSYESGFLCICLYSAEHAEIMARQVLMGRNPRSGEPVEWPGRPPEAFFNLISFRIVKVTMNIPVSFSRCHPEEAEEEIRDYQELYPDAKIVARRAISLETVQEYLEHLLHRGRRR